MMFNHPKPAGHTWNRQSKTPITITKAAPTQVTAITILPSGTALLPPPAANGLAHHDHDLSQLPFPQGPARPARRALFPAGFACPEEAG